jgi:hypothetical protein
MEMAPELKIAIIRGVWSAFVSAGGTFFTTVSLLGATEAAIAAGAAAFFALGWRAGEGIRDSRGAV